MTERKTRFDSIHDYYDDNPARRSSGEAMYGVMWKTDAGYGTAGVSYVQATGEVYAELHGPTEPVEILGFWPPDDQGVYYASLDQRLEGWPEMCGKPGGLDWLRSKLHPTPYWVRPEEAGSRPHREDPGSWSSAT